MFVSFVACNTGIESTKTIRMSKAEKKDILPSDEDIFAEKLKVDEIAEWKIGKNFLVSDPKASLILESENKDLKNDLAGTVISFDGILLKPTAGDNNVAVIKFIDPNNNNIYYYNTSRSLESASKEITGLDVPALIDLDLVNMADSIMKGKMFWIKTKLWYDDNDNSIQGRKFIPVEINKVAPGNMFFPLSVIFTDDRGNNYKIYMNVKDKSGLGAESRTFPTLFSMEDPKLKYPAISEEVWTTIQNGRVSLGMTKNECRLSLGTPSDVDSGHDWNNTIDIWRYKDGTFLQFQDGLLVNYRY